jgi:thiol-disulfide isomerase/thioredoxin
MKIIGFILFLLSFTPTAFSQQVKVIDHYQDINSIQNMLSHFKGKVVFIDLWATWCYPCLDEFKFNQELDEYLTEKHIVKLYVSINKDEEDSVWHSDIQKLKLYGYHIRANKALQNELETLIWGAPGGYSIPHYLLFDKSGTVRSKDLMPPSSTKQLYNQLDVLLKD